MIKRQKNDIFEKNYKLMIEQIRKLVKFFRKIIFMNILIIEI